MLPNQKSYVALQVNITPATTALNLLALMRAVDASCPGTCRELTVQIDPDTPACKVKIGDANLAVGRYGYMLIPTASRTYRSVCEDVLIADLWVWSDTNNTKLNVEVMV